MSKPKVVDVEQPLEMQPPLKVGTGKGKMGAQQQVYMNLIKQLTDKAASIVVGVAVCECNHKDSCEVYQDARGIAKIIRELQEVSKGAKGRPRVRA